MNTHFNQLTHAEDERLTILAEEAAEVIKVVMKIKRHGWNAAHAGKTYDNRKDLETECGDFLSAMERCTVAHDLSYPNVFEALKAKTISAKEYLHHQ